MLIIVEVPTDTIERWIDGYPDIDIVPWEGGVIAVGESHRLDALQVTASVRKRPFRWWRLGCNSMNSVLERRIEALERRVLELARGDTRGDG